MLVEAAVCRLYSHTCEGKKLQVRKSERKRKKKTDRRKNELHQKKAAAATNKYKTK